MNINEYWLEFLIKNNMDQNKNYRDAIKLGESKDEIDSNIDLILNEKKKILVSSLLKYKDPKFDSPQEGDLKIILDNEDNPVSIIETTKVRIILFKNIDYNIVTLEGTNQTLARWQREMIDHFTKDAEKNNYKFAYDMPIVIEEIDVIYKG